MFAGIRRRGLPMFSTVEPLTGRGRFRRVSRVRLLAVAFSGGV